MVIFEVTVTDGGDFDAVRFNALYRSESRAHEVGALELARAQKRYRGDDMEATFKRQVVVTVTPRQVR